MKKFKKLFLMACLTLCLVLACTACGKKKNTNTMDKNTVYRETPINVTLPENGNIQYLFAAGDKLILIGYEYNYDDYTSKNFFMSLNTDGSNLVKKDLKFDDNNSWLERMVVTDDSKLYGLFSSYTERWENDEYFYETIYTIKEFDMNFNMVKEVKLNDLGEFSWIDGFYPVKGGKLLLCGSEKFFVLDNNLKVVKTGEGFDISSFITAKDGRNLVSYWGNSGLEFAYFNVDTLTKGDVVEVPGANNFYNMAQGTTYDLIAYDSQQIYGYNIGDAELKPLMNYINSDLPITSFNSLVQLNDGSFVGTYYDWLFSEDGNKKMCRYTKVAPEDVVDKQIITLGCLYLSSDVQKQVIEFNKNSEEYRITIKDYSSFNTMDDWGAGEAKMNSDVASGLAPDIIISSTTGTIANYISKGLFIDLKKYIDKDEELSIDDLFPNLVEACSYKGKLYSIVPGFYINTMVGKTSKLNGRTSWTMQEMLDFEKSLPEGCSLFYNATRDYFLSDMLEVNSDYFVNMTTGQCHFDSPEFIQLLEYCKTLPKEISYNDGDIIYEKAVAIDDIWGDNYNLRFRSDKAILEQTTISDFYTYKYLQNGTFGEDITFIGYPSTDGNGSSISFDFALAISSKCANPDGAWQFIRHFLTLEYQNSRTWGIPANMTAFDELAKKSQERSFYEWEGEIYYNDDYYWLGDESVIIEMLTDADIAKFKQAILATTKLRGSIDEVITIIDEEAQAFFEGQKSAEDVAKIIQSRATIYISEKQ